MARALLAEQACVSRDPGNPQSTYTLQSLARIAGVLQDEFLPYLDQAIAPLLAALSTDAEVSLVTVSARGGLGSTWLYASTGPEKSF